MIGTMTMTTTATMTKIRRDLWSHTNIAICCCVAIIYMCFLVIFCWCLQKCLTTLDLTSLGVGSCCGTGMYLVAGMVAKSIAGPGVVLSFCIAAIASIFSGKYCLGEPISCLYSKMNLVGNSNIQLKLIDTMSFIDFLCVIYFVIQVHAMQNSVFECHILLVQHICIHM